MILPSNVWKMALAAIAIGLCCISAEAANLVSHYEFEGNTNDSVAGGPTGTIVDFNPGNPASGLGAGKIGAGALDLNFGDIMTTTTSGHPTGADLLSGTIAMWVMTAPGLTDGELSNINLMGNLNDLDSTAYLFGTNGVGNLQLFPRAADGSQARPRVAPGGDVFALERSWADGQWHHLAVTFDNGPANGSSTGQWYIDGNPIDTQVADQALNSGDTFSPWEFDMVIGGRNNRGNPDGFLPGGVMLDDIRVYDMPLSQSEINQLPGLIPEPTALALSLLGLVASAGYRRR